MQGVFLRKYGTATTVDFTLYKLDGTGLKADAAHASGDTKIMKDEAAEANTANGFTDEGQTYSIALSAAEMEAARVVLIVVDQSSPQVWLDTTIVIETYGHASAMHRFDMSQATPAVDVAAISGDSTAADNLEAACDGNTYNVGGGAIVAASVTAGVSLADDAITAAKFDESTAFPLKSADTGATAVARTGADSDTLETLSDEIAALNDLDAADIRSAVGLASANLDTQLSTIDGVVDAILADTGTDGVVLADDAITAAKFDESTAFPLKSADTGATAVARTGADSDTLETLSDQLDAVLDAVGAVSYLTLDGTTADKIWQTDGGLVDLPTGNLVVDMWVRQTSYPPYGDTRYFLYKGFWQVRQEQLNDAIRAIVVLGTTNAEMLWNNVMDSLDEWMHLTFAFSYAGTLPGAGTKRINLAINGVWGYTTRTDGVGTYSADTANALTIGNLWGSKAFGGDIGWVRVRTALPSEIAAVGTTFIPHERQNIPRPDANTLCIYIHEGEGTTTANLGTVGGAATIVDAVWGRDQGFVADAVWNYGDRTVTGADGDFAQDVRDAMKLAPTAGAPAAGSVDAHLDTIEGDTTTDIPTQISGLNDLDAADIRSAVGLASANLDTQLSTIDTVVDAILADTGTDGVVLADDAITTAKIATGAIDADALAADAVDEILDEVVEGTLTMRQALRIFLAALAGKSTGGGTVTVTFRDEADGKARITATVDANGNRTAVTLDGS